MLEGLAVCLLSHLSHSSALLINPCLLEEQHLWEDEGMFLKILLLVCASLGLVAETLAVFYTAGLDEQFRFCDYIRFLGDVLTFLLKVTRI